MREKVLPAVCALLLLCGTAAAQPSEWCWNMDVIRAEVEGSTITVYHDNAYYNCCPSSFYHAVTLEGSLILIHELEIDPQCLCLCCFNLNTVVEDVAPGTYQIDFSWYDYEVWETVHRYLEVVVPDLGQPGLFAPGASAASNCLSSPPSGMEPLIPSTARLQLLPPVPNPSSGGVELRYVLGRSEAIRLEVYSAAGTCVRTLRPGQSAAGADHLWWDGRDDAGRDLPGGVYFVRLSAAGEVCGQTLILLR